MPVVSGNRLIRSGSLPATQAAVDSESAEAQPEVTRAAWQPSRSAILLPTASCRSSRRTYLREATCIAATTAGRINEPVKAVNVPAALMNERTPSSPITSRKGAVSWATAGLPPDKSCMPGAAASAVRNVRRLVWIRLIASLHGQVGNEEGVL